MVPMIPKEQLQFLISCVNHSVKGKVDWAAVAKELNIVSQSAAAERYDCIVKSVSVEGAHTETSESPDSTQNSPVHNLVSKNFMTSNQTGNRITKTNKTINMTDIIRPRPAKSSRKRTADEMDSSDEEPNANNGSESDNDPLVSPLVEMLKRKRGGGHLITMGDMENFPLQLQRDDHDVEML